MVWAGTQTVIVRGPDFLEISSTGFDADTETGTVIDIYDATISKMTLRPKSSS